MTIAIWEEKDSFGLCFYITAYHQRKSEQELKQGRNLEARVYLEAIGVAAYWFAPFGLLSLLSYGTHITWD